MTLRQVLLSGGDDRQEPQHVGGWEGSEDGGVREGWGESPMLVRDDQNIRGAAAECRPAERQGLQHGKRRGNPSHSVWQVSACSVQSGVSYG